MNKKTVPELIARLEALYPKALCTLDYTEPYQLVVGARLAAQCTDERVNKTTPALYAAYPTLQSLAEADVSSVAALVRPCGFFNSKARDIVAMANTLLTAFGGTVPGTMDELLTLPGVGRKTANLILGDVFGAPSVVVDTHCIRLSNRIGLVKNMKDPVKIETALRKLLPENKSSDFCHRLVMHGRAVCAARAPRCAECALRDICDAGRRAIPDAPARQ
ncbi:MAG: endonuclease III [Oscillospiraceae bacterium]|nr:endonuclease III [Oscillospiraceae bacterium]